MKLSIPDLESKTEKATPGPWEWDRDYDLVAPKAETVWNEVKVVHGASDVLVSDEDYGFIATANPETIQTLTRNLRLAVEALEYYGNKDIAAMCTCGQNILCNELKIEANETLTKIKSEVTF